MKSPICWMGGKSQLQKRIVAEIPEHKTYVEVFGGAGWVLFGKEPSEKEIFNDLDENLMNFWRVVRDKPDKFLESYKWEIISRDVFDDYKEKYLNNNYKDDVEQAHIFYYLNKLCFGGVMNPPSLAFGLYPPRLNFKTLEKNITRASKRLQNVVLENKSFEEIFEKYDSEDTFFFLDSPYRDTRGYKVGKFTDENYRKLASCCKNAKGSWLYTINNDEFFKELFKEYNFITQDVFYSVCKEEKGRKEYKELMITNF